MRKKDTNEGSEEKGLVEAAQLPSHLSRWEKIVKSNVAIIMTASPSASSQKVYKISAPFRDTAKLEKTYN